MLVPHKPVLDRATIHFLELVIAVCLVKSAKLGEMRRERLVIQVLFVPLEGFSTSYLIAFIRQTKFLGNYLLLGVSPYQEFTVSDEFQLICS